MGGRQNQYRVTHFKQQEKCYGKAPWQYSAIFVVLLVLHSLAFIFLGLFLFLSVFCFSFSFYHLCTLHRVSVFFLLRYLLIVLHRVYHAHSETDNTRFITIFTNSFKKECTRQHTMVLLAYHITGLRMVYGNSFLYGKWMYLV